MCSGLSSSALDLSNVLQIDLEDTLFRDCISSNGSEQFRGNGGAVSIAYHNASFNSTKPTLTVTNCSFINNSAFLPISSGDERRSALTTNLFLGRGGAMNIVPQGPLANVTAFIRDTTFLNNSAETFGGAVFLSISGMNTYHNFTFERCNFTNNTAGNTSFGGGIQIAFLINNLESPPTRINFKDSYFEGNFAYFGGGLSAVQVSILYQRSVS